MLDAEMLAERRFEAVDVIVTVFPPAVAGGISGILDLEFGDRRLGVVDALAHRISFIVFVIPEQP